MKPGARKHYHSKLWPAVCAKQGWRRADDEKRRDVCLDCMEAVGGPMVTTSDPLWDNAETTALFTYLEHLADPDNITLAMRWDQCRADYKAFNTSKQADYYERRTFGQRGSGKIRNNRFGGRQTAVGLATEEPLTAQEANQRLWKYRQLARQREPRTKPARRVTADPAKTYQPRKPNPELTPF